MNEAGFYKLDNGDILYAPNIVEGPGYVLLINEKDTYVYPVDGWVYADSQENASVLLMSEVLTAVPATVTELNI
jgi:hypothetical protein